MDFCLPLLKCACKAINYFSYFSFPHSLRSFCISVVKITLLSKGPHEERNVCKAFMSVIYTNCIQVDWENFRRYLTCVGDWQNFETKAKQPVLLFHSIDYEKSLHHF